MRHRSGRFGSISTFLAEAARRQRAPTKGDQFRRVFATAVGIARGPPDVDSLLKTAKALGLDVPPLLQCLYKQGHVAGPLFPQATNRGRDPIISPTD
jgi:hypothetical protein